MKTIQLLLLCLLAFIGFGTTPANAQGQAEPRFAAGQTFVLRIAGVPQQDANQVTGQYSVSSGGTVRLPFLTEVSAIGLTPTELQRKLEAAYKSGEIYTHPTISISTNANAGSDMVITVGGEVRQPADVPFRAGINLYAAITRCGGPTEYGDMKRVKLMRGKTERVIDLRKVGNDNNPELQAGDQVIVPGS